MTRSEDVGVSRGWMQGCSEGLRLGRWTWGENNLEKDCGRVDLRLCVLEEGELGCMVEAL